MKYLKQFAIILAVCLVGEGLKALLPLPIPASIYGLVLMLAALMSGLLKLEQVEKRQGTDPSARLRLCIGGGQPRSDRKRVCGSSEVELRSQYRVEKGFQP